MADKTAEIIAMLAKPGRTGMYLRGCASIYRFDLYMDAYCRALRDHGIPSPFDGFPRWVQMRFGVCHSAWGWPRILHHFYGTQRAALEALPLLYAEYLRDVEQLGHDEIDRRLKAKLLAEYGRNYHEPESSHTSVDEFMKMGPPRE